MKQAKYRLLLLSVSLMLVFAGVVFVSGCISSAISRGDMTITGEEPAPAPPTFPPMYNYPKNTQAMSAADISGKFSSGDIVQPDKDSSVFDPDLAVVIVRDNGDGSYEVDSISRNAGEWNRTPSLATGTISHDDLERLFPVKVGHMDSPSVSGGQGK
jgi:hypothetical protein